MELTIKNTRLELELGDITKCKVEAVVNAANPELSGGGGVDGAIHRVGGYSIQEACRRLIAQIGRLDPGRAVMTHAGRLPAKFVIHTVGPIWRGGTAREPEILAAAYAACLRLADDMGVKSIAFPSLSTGAFGYPPELAAPIALGTVARYLSGDTHLQEVRFVLHDRTTLDPFEAALNGLSGAGA